VRKPGVTVELVSERTAITPGETAALALVFRHDAGVHTYWRQPGVVGLATSMKWSLPAGFRAGAILWPAPERTKMGHWGVWGFERDVALVVPVEVPADLNPATTPQITLTTTAMWMACGDTCHPGSASFSLTLPVAAKPAPLTSSAGIIAKTRDEQPVARPEWKATASLRKSDRKVEGFVLTLTPPAGRQVPKDAYFFGTARLVDSHSDQAHRPGPDGSTSITLNLIETPDPIPDHLEGELFSAAGWDPDGKHRLLAIRVPLGRNPPADALPAGAAPGAR
jgi:thiol:disulfide interchange protein DsbD